MRLVSVSLVLALGGVGLCCGCGSEASQGKPAPVGGQGQGAGGNLVGGGGQSAGGDAGQGGAVETGGGGAGAAGGGADGGGGGGGEAGQGGGGPGPGCLTGSFTAYRGNLHAHTSYSDGAQKPEDAFAHARDVAGLDIMVVTDHLEQLYLVPPFDRWGECLKQADAAYSPGSFVAACGFEYGSGMELPLCVSTGHNNVFFADALFPAVQVSFKDFYASLAACGPCIGQFNHPGDSSCQHWHEFEYSPATDPKMNLFEFNGDGAVWERFFQALDAGWHVSPVVNQDNHGADWGTKNDYRSGFFMSALSRMALWQAMLERRSFMSRDKNATIRMMADGVCWMGSVMSGYSSLEVTVSADDPDGGDGFTDITLHGPAQAVLGTHDCGGKTQCQATFAVPVPQATYLVARAWQTDGADLVAAPIWVSP